jgi:hypothetical protein
MLAAEHWRKESWPWRYGELKQSGRINGPVDYRLFHGNLAIPDY